MPIRPDEELDAVCRALGHPVRRRILNLLRSRPHTTMELWAAMRPGRSPARPSRPLEAPSRPLAASSRPLATPSRPLEAPSRQALEQHLGVLERAGLVVSSRDGRTRYNHLNPLPLQRLHRRWLRYYLRLKPAHLLLMRTWPGRRPDRPVGQPPWHSRPDRP